MTAATTSVPTPLEPLFTRAFVMLGLAELAYFTGLGVAVYALPLYVTGPLGSDRAAAGIAFGAFAVSALLLRPVAGRLADVWGRSPLLVGGAVLAAVCTLLTAYAGSLAVVVLLRLLLGVAEAAFFVAGFAALADLAPASRMGEALSYNSLGLYLGLTVGPPLGELLVETWGFTVGWYGGAGLAVLAASVALMVGETREPGPAAGHSRLIHRKSIPAGLAFLTSLVAIGGFLSLVTLHARGVGMGSASLPLFAYGAVVVCCRIAFARVPDRLPSLPLGAAALATIAAGLTVLAVWSAPIGAVAGSVLLAVGVTFSTPAFFSAIFSTAAPSERGAAAGTASVFMDLGLGGGPILLGVVAEGSGIPAAFGVAAGVALLGALWALRLHTGPPARRRAASTA
jgi:predicted MFS family arabinose efflux permease